VREPAIRFLVLLVGPAVTQGESDAWGASTGQGSRDPGDLAAIEAEVRRQGPSGFDPLPSIRALRIPALWLYGGNDLNVPTRLSVERLDPLTREPGRDLSYVVFPKANHGLVESEHGLQAEVERSSSFAPGLYPAIEAWLARRGLRG
jgi:pimeloyl-ACP methyl ester carboxylesterase